MSTEAGNFAFGNNLHSNDKKLPRRSNSSEKKPDVILARLYLGSNELRLCCFPFPPIYDKVGRIQAFQAIQ